MDVILLERIEKLGQMGDTVKVKPGYARNFLLPQKKALRASKQNLAYFESRRADLEAHNLEHRKEAEGIAGRMTDVTVVLIRQAGDAGQLYGSVSARDIAAAVTEAGYKVTKNQVAIDKPIKSLGLFPVRVVLHPEVSVKVTVNVARSADEAEMQKARGGMITADMAEAEEIAAEEAAQAEENAEGTATQGAVETEADASER
ncbi:MAG: 50S ribosomal protein L9 [Inquilinaceae bacterium]